MKENEIQAGKNVLRGIEWAAAILITSLSVALHFIFLCSAGGLWRDEAHTVKLAQMPSFSELWSQLGSDSFPILWVFVLRLLSALGLESDFGFRVIGFSVGLTCLGVMWFTARSLKSKFPFFLLIFAGLSPLFIIYGDSLRAWGWGLMWLMLEFTLLWRVIESPTRCRIALATLAGIAAAQSTYYNCVLLFVFCSAGCLVAVRRTQWRTALLMPGICAVAGLTMLPYLNFFRSNSSAYEMIRVRYEPGDFMKKTLGAMSGSDPFGLELFNPWIWWILLIIAAGLVVTWQFKSLSENWAGRCGRGFWLWTRRLGRSIPAAGFDGRANAVHRQKTRRPEGFRGKGRLASLLLSRRYTTDILLRRASPSGLFPENSTQPNFQTGSKTQMACAKDGHSDLLLYAGLVMLLSVPAYFLFLHALRFVTSPWYYLSLIVTIALGLEAVFSVSEKWVIARLFRLISALVIVAVVIFRVFLPVFPVVKLRMTNVDLMARYLNDTATKADMVVVDPYFCMVSFKRNYSGAAPCVSLPAIDNPLERFDLLIPYIVRPDRKSAIQNVLDEMRRTLKAGGRVWMVSNSNLKSESIDSEPQPPQIGANLNITNTIAVFDYWSSSAAYLLQSHSVHHESIAISAHEPVSKFENTKLTLATGWQEEQTIAKSKTVLNPH